MADHTANAMQAAIRSMREVVIPAVDPDHPLAREQAGLVVKYLEFWVARVDRIGERNRAELATYTSMGQALLPSAGAVSPALQAELSKAVGNANSLLASTSVDVSALRRAVATLTELISALVRVANEADQSATHQVGQIVVDHSGAIALLQRSWFGPQGWEDPLPPDLDHVLAQQLAEGTST